MHDLKVSTTLNHSTAVSVGNHGVQPSAASAQGVLGQHTFEQGVPSTPQPRSATLVRTERWSLQKLGDLLKRNLVPDALRSDNRAIKALKNALHSGNSEKIEKSVQNFLEVVKGKIAENSNYQQSMTAKLTDFFKSERPTYVEKIRAQIVNKCIEMEQEEYGSYLEKVASGEAPLSPDNYRIDHPNSSATLTKGTVDLAFNTFKEDIKNNKGAYVHQLKEKFNSVPSFQSNEQSLNFIAHNIALFREAICVEVMLTRMEQKNVNESEVVAAESAKAAEQLLSKVFEGLDETAKSELLQKYEYWVDVSDAVAGGSFSDNELKNPQAGDNLRALRNIADALAASAPKDLKSENNSYKSQLATITKESSQINSKILDFQEKIVQISGELKNLTPNKSDPLVAKEISVLIKTRDDLEINASDLRKPYQNEVAKEKPQKDALEAQRTMHLEGIKNLVLKNSDFK